MQAVDFVVDQPIAAPRDDVEAAFLDPDFYRALGEIPDIAEPEIIERHDRNGITELSVRFQFTGHLAPPVRAVLDPSKLTWVQQSRIDRQNHRADFRMEPEHYGRKLECTGSYQFDTCPDGSTLQRVKGQVRVNWPLVGGTVERAIVSGLREHLATEARILEQWVQDRNGEGR
jgi:hypothetical protein